MDTGSLQIQRLEPEAIKPTCQGSQPPFGPRSIQDGHLERSFPLSITWFQIPYDKIRDFASARLLEFSQMQTHTFAPQAPKASGKTPEERRTSRQDFQHPPWRIFGRTAIA
ncbi:PREDICTED: uncharacterized protein LOC105003622 [Bison bison bison]|uniref:Uncharacterized protein LOC105003622 n=1 Tax=Bison bison bison TaxID=43346 RepID=A0A6P3J729_BISBB|nr:PREDICTED: uncharacterized protein LOC105003622 [Bison bison bison]